MSMNTINNFRINNSYINQNQNKSINNKIYSSAGQQPAQNIQFKGLNLKAIKSLMHNSKAVKNAMTEQKNSIAFMLQIPNKEVMSKTEGISKNSLNFLETLTRNFHAKYGYRRLKESIPEEPDVVFEVFNKVKNPKKDHFELANRMYMLGSIKNIGHTYELIGDNPQKLKLANHVSKEILNKGSIKHSPNLLPEILQSKHAETYAKNFKQYEPYLQAHKNDENAVKNLDKMVSNGTYNKKIIEQEIQTKNLLEKHNLGQTKILNLETINKNRTEEGDKFLDSFVGSFACSSDSVAAGNDKDILAMYKSTNKKNLSLRQGLMKMYAYKKFDNLCKHEYNESVSDLRQLFDRLDQDKHAANYVKKSIKNNNGPKHIKSFITLFDSVPTKKLDIFYDNIHNIRSQSYSDKDYKILRENIENPLFLTAERKEHQKEMRNYGIKEGFTTSQKICRVINNTINKIRYKLSGGDEGIIAKTAGKDVEKANIENRMQEFVNINQKPAVEIKPETVAKAVETTETAPAKPVVENQIQPVKKRVIKHFSVVSAPKTPNAKKLAVINDVNNIIEKKLGSKTLADQQRTYASKATKMRMQMLPEIFASIKETRAAERAAGKKPSVSNQDALRLYTRINGKNKKLVNYMLKKRNADGTRTFGFGEVLSTIEQNELKFHKQKFTTPKTYNPAEVKAYYANLLDSQIQAHGKLQKTKKS